MLFFNFFFTSHHPQALGLFNNRKSDEQMKKKKEQIEEKRIEKRLRDKKVFMKIHISSNYTQGQQKV